MNQRRINLKQPTMAAVDNDMAAFLDLPEIKARHNGLGTADLRQRAAAGVSKKRMMADFGDITFATLKRYLIGLGLWIDKS